MMHVPTKAVSNLGSPNPVLFKLRRRKCRTLVNNGAIVSVISREVYRMLYPKMSLEK